LTFHDRAKQMPRLADYLAERSDSLYRLSAEVGTARRDPAGDIAGAIGLMNSLARTALTELPNATIAPDGPPEFLPGSRDIAGQHLYVSPAAWLFY
jgi:acyl-CoA reductase-like NAD-dependent aldehyde dehydrogenase